MTCRKMLAFGIAALSLHVFAGTAPAEMYKWTDKDGTLHVTDYPPEGGGKAMDLESIRINRMESGASGGPAANGAPAREAPRPSPAASAAPRGRDYPRVQIYGTSWCPYCRDARDYFRSRGIPFEDYDVEADAAARARREQYGGSGVPVIVIGDRVVRGFSPEGVERVLEAR